MNKDDSLIDNIEIIPKQYREYTEIISILINAQYCIDSHCIESPLIYLD